VFDKPLPPRAAKREETTMTNSSLKRMNDYERHGAIYAALVGAGLHDLIHCRWSVEDHDGCDTAWMLTVVCLEQTAERKVPFDVALGDLVGGHAPRGATPYPDAAEALLARRDVEVEV
jgi:hypothetical protein